MGRFVPLSELLLKFGVRLLRVLLVTIGGVLYTGPDFESSPSANLDLLIGGVEGSIGREEEGMGIGVVSTIGILVRVVLREGRLVLDEDCLAVGTRLISKSRRRLKTNRGP